MGTQSPQPSLIRSLMWLTTAAFLLLFGLAACSSLITGAQWFQSVDQEAMYWWLIGFRTSVLLLSAGAAFWWIQGAVSLAARLSSSLDAPEEPTRRPLLTGLAAVVCLILGAWLSSQWLELVTGLASPRHGWQSPITGLDAGWYTHLLPALDLVLLVAVVVALLRVCVAAPVYLLKQSLGAAGKPLVLSPAAARRLRLLVSDLCVALALRLGVAGVMTPLEPFGGPVLEMWMLLRLAGVIAVLWLAWWLRNQEGHEPVWYAVRAVAVLSIVWVSNAGMGMYAATEPAVSPDRQRQIDRASQLAYSVDDLRSQPLIISAGQGESLPDWLRGVTEVTPSLRWGVWRSDDHEGDAWCVVSEPEVRSLESFIPGNRPGMTRNAVHCIVWAGVRHADGSLIWRTPRSGVRLDIHFGMESYLPMPVVDPDHTLKGVPLTRWSRFWWMVRLGDPSLMRNPQDDQVFLARRNAAQRLYALAPFLSFDADPVPIWNDGRLIWCLNATMASRRFPLSRQQQVQVDKMHGYVVNGLRWVGAGLVDAVTGETEIVALRPDEPLLSGWRRLFPDLIADESRLAPQVIRRLYYPASAWRLQQLVER